MDTSTQADSGKATRVKLPKSVVLRPAFEWDRVKQYTEHDPEGAEQFVAVIRKMRVEDRDAEKP